MAENPSLAAPNFDLIRDESGTFTADALKTLWYALNDERSLRYRYDQASWVIPAFVAGDFVGDANGNWTVDSGDVNGIAYIRRGRQMTVTFSINTSSLSSGTITDLYIKNGQWGGYTSSSSGATARSVCVIKDNAAALTTGAVFVLANATQIGIERSDGASWQSSTNQTSVHGQITFEVQV